MPNFRRAEVTSSENEGLKMIFFFFCFSVTANARNACSNAERNGEAKSSWSGINQQ